MVGFLFKAKHESKSYLSGFFFLVSMV